jgi:hypothetical protein
MEERLSISIRCGSCSICGNIRVTFRWQRGEPSASGETGCGRNSSAILGWQDIPLRPWTYLALTILLLVPLQKLQLGNANRARLITLSGLTALGYVVLIYLIFFLTYAPLDVDHVRGVQGRYFVIALPVMAICIAAAVNRELPAGLSAAIATTGGLISGITTVEALFEAHW